MLDVIPQIGNITNNTNSHNTMNNQFNIQMFLNEPCIQKEYSNVWI